MSARVGLRHLAAVTAGTGLLLLTACADDPAADHTPTAQPTATATTIDPVEENTAPAISAPLYEIVTEPARGEDGLIAVTVDEMITAEEANVIVYELHSGRTDDGGYHVRLNCSTGGTANVDNRLANAKFAIGPIGEARTGLDDGEVEVEVIGGAQCPADAPPPEAPTPEAPTPEPSASAESDETATFLTGRENEPWAASVVSAHQDAPDEMYVKTTIVDPRGDDGSLEAQAAIEVCEQAVAFLRENGTAGPVSVRVEEADESTFVLHSRNDTAGCIEV